MVPVDTRGRSRHTDTHARPPTHPTKHTSAPRGEPDRSGEWNHILTKPTADDELDE